MIQFGIVFLTLVIVIVSYIFWKPRKSEHLTMNTTDKSSTNKFSTDKSSIDKSLSDDGSLMGM